MNLPEWSMAGAAGSQPILADFKTQPEDFVVNEVFAEPWSGAGEHLMLRIVKRDITTAAVARQLEAHYGVGGVAIGFAGQKDRRGVCTQWFSIHTVEDQPPAALEKAQTLQIDRHRSKLRRGSHACNQFDIRLRCVSDVQALTARLKQVACGGAPNYFGEQRFGGDNLARASAWLGTRKRLSPFTRGLYLSTLRSFLFNEVLSARIAAANWAEAIDGDD